MCTLVGASVDASVGAAVGSLLGTVVGAIVRADVQAPPPEHQTESSPRHHQVFWPHYAPTKCVTTSLASAPWSPDSPSESSQFEPAVFEADVVVPLCEADWCSAVGTELGTAVGTAVGS